MNGPGWALAWLDAYPEHAPVVFVARIDKKAVGLLAMTEVKGDARDLFIPRICPLAPGVTDYQRPLVRPEVAADVLPALLDAVRARFGRRRLLWWPNLPSDDPLAPIMRDYFRGRAMPFVETVQEAPRLDFNGRDFAAIQASWTSKHRVDARRRWRKLETEVGPPGIWTPSTEAEAEAFLEEFFQVHDEKWRRQGHPGIFGAPAVRRHYHAMVKRMLNRGLHISALRSGSINISFHVGFLSGGWLQWYRPSYRWQYDNFSPSKLHIHALIEQGVADGWTGFDFLLGDEKYKFSWSNDVRQVTSFFAANRRNAEFLWFSEWRPKVRQAAKRVSAALRAARQSNSSSAA